jgi:MoaA/NifB/PqqE/SkfB family radical SAM enzyme
VSDSPWIGPNGQIMERLELHLTYTCPEKCVFCSEEHRMEKYKRFPVTWGRVAKVLRTHASRGVQNVHFTGGEPTIHPRFVQALQLAKKLGMKTSIGTIGTKLSKRKFAKRALPYLDEALFSLHGPTAAVHDALTQREGSFSRVTGAIQIAQEIKPAFNVYINTVITKQNVYALPDTIALADSLGAKLIVVSNTTPEGGGGDLYKELAVPLSELREVISQVPAKVSQATVRFFGVPMCLLGEHFAWSNDLHWDPRVTVEWMSKPGKVQFDGIYSWTPDRRRVHTKECSDCLRKKICMGVFDTYAELWDTSELRPYLQSESS